MDAATGKPEMGCAVIKIIGVGRAGCRMLLAASPLPGEWSLELVAVHPVDSVPHPDAGYTLVPLVDGWERLIQVVRDADMVIWLGDPVDVSVPGYLAKAVGMARKQGILSVVLARRHRRFGPEDGQLLAYLYSQSDATTFLPKVHHRMGTTETSAIRAFIHAVCGSILLDGVIGVDFADVRAVLAGSVYGVVGRGWATGENRAEVAAQNAIADLMGGRKALRAASGVLVAITIRDSVQLNEFTRVGEMIARYASDEALVVISAPEDSRLRDEDFKVTIVATGLHVPRLGCLSG